jgi:hypothetical protein
VKALDAPEPVSSSLYDRNPDLRSPPKKESRPATYQTAKDGKGGDEATNQRIHIPQQALCCQAVKWDCLSCEILAQLFPELEFKTTTEQPVTGRRLQGFAKFNIDGCIAELRKPFVRTGKRASRFDRIAVQRALSKFVEMEVA